MHWAHSARYLELKELLKIQFTMFCKAGNMTNFRGGLLADLFLASISETNRCWILYFLSARNLGVISLQNKKCLKNWKFLLILSRNFLARRKCLAKAPAQYVMCDKAVPIISQIACCSCGRVLFELPAQAHLFEVLVNDGNWHVGLGSKCALIHRSRGLQRVLWVGTTVLNGVHEEKSNPQFSLQGLRHPTWLSSVPHAAWQPSTQCLSS